MQFFLIQYFILIVFIIATRTLAEQINKLASKQSNTHMYTNDSEVLKAKDTHNYLSKPNKLNGDNIIQCFLSSNASLFFTDVFSSTVHMNEMFRSNLDSKINDRYLTFFKERLPYALFAGIKHI